MSDHSKVLVVAGPTASGKSDLAVDVAENFGGVVINADSMQIYEGLDVLTAAPSNAARRRAPHKLYGIRDPAMPCSAGEWADLATREIHISQGEGLLPIVVGGTGLYLRTLMTGIAKMPAISSKIRNDVRERLVRSGSKAMHAELTSIDPSSAARIEPSDSQRLARALEIYEETGRTLTEWQLNGSEKDNGFDFSTILLEPARDLLYSTCDARFQNMLQSGALEEIQALVQRNLDPNLPTMKALGVPHLIRHLAGEITFEEACKAGQQATRNYVKRQGTWFRNQFIAGLRVESQYSNNTKPNIFSFVSKIMLT